MTMHSFAKGAVVFVLAVAMTVLSACSDQQPTTPGSPGSNGASALGSSQYNAALPPPSPSGTVVGGAVDQADSQNLTDYLKNHHLPLVNGQVVMSPAGKRQVILFGYVASQYGKSDAEQKARTFLNDPQLLVDNRITISPELAGSEGGGSSNGSSNGSSSASSGGSGSNYDPYAQSNSIQAYQQQGAGFNPYAAQQQYPTNNFSGLNLLMGLLGGGMSIGGGGGGFGGGFGGGYGGFGGGPPSSFGGYGYPSYPPPPMGSGFP
jgi:hypothetical protein